MNRKAKILGRASIHLAIMYLEDGFEKDQFLSCMAAHWDLIVKENNLDEIVRTLLLETVQELEEIRDEHDPN